MGVKPAIQLSQKHYWGNLSKIFKIIVFLADIAYLLKLLGNL